MAKKKYQTWTLERHVEAPREVAWQALLDFIPAATGGYQTPGEPIGGPGATVHLSIGGYEMVETVLSLEAPWRRVYELTSGSPVAFYEATTTIRDDGDTCHIAWCAVIDPYDTDESQAFVEFSRRVIDGALDQIVALAEGAHQTT